MVIKALHSFTSLQAIPLEVTFLFPWAISLRNIDLFGFWTMMIFLIILTIGFVYEWRKGALEWE